MDVRKLSTANPGQNIDFGVWYRSSERETLYKTASTGF